MQVCCSCQVTAKLHNVQVCCKRVTYCICLNRNSVMGKWTSTEWLRVLWMVDIQCLIKGLCHDIEALTSIGLAPSQTRRDLVIWRIHQGWNVMDATTHLMATSKNDIAECLVMWKGRCDKYGSFQERYIPGRIGCHCPRQVSGQASQIFRSENK